MNDKPRPKKSPPNEELREKLLKIAIETDVVAHHIYLDNWRLSAVIAARWLLRAAAEAPKMPKEFQQTIIVVKKLSGIMNDEIIEDFDLKRRKLLRLV
jgi:hypothetical protein